MSDDTKRPRKLTQEELMQLENYDPEYKVDASFSPCKDCPTRYLGCHAKCYKYIVYRQARDDYNERIRKERHMYLSTFYCDLSKPFHHGFSIRRKHRK